MVGWWTTPIAALPPSDPPQPVMLTDPHASWVRALEPVPGAMSLLVNGTAKPLVLRAVTPVWSDVATNVRGEPFSGRFFLTHRDQVDLDLLG
mmetsp:Transcript_22526/g.52629  ORF Transcript_22526/g.52629 Transcript_22526/m.52629 type:complete len:92 (-) Transcript_22526:76-351(-)